MNSTPPNSPQSQGVKCPFTSRRNFLAAAGGLAASALLEARARGSNTPATQPEQQNGFQSEPFWGEHQAGILTSQQSHTYFATFDLSPAATREQLIRVLEDWTVAAARLSRGESVDKLDIDPEKPAPDSGEVVGLPAARLTITFGFGATLFTKDGKDRFGLAAKRPEALVDLPKFHGDQLVEASTGGDLSLQACANDLQVAFHAVRQLARIADGVAQLRWVQTGFLPQFGTGQTPRNLMGFKDGTNNPSPSQPETMNQFVWADTLQNSWMRGGSYLVVRRIRIALEHWDRTSLAFQEQTIGRRKYSGAPLGSQREFEQANLDANGKDGEPVIPDTSHIRLASPENNDGARILRRSYSYNDGVNFTSERWPPWKQGMEYDAGLLFIAYQKDPRTGFIKIFDAMSRLDMMNQFVTHVGGGLFACPGGVSNGEFIGQRLFNSV
jgi:deferrochelatase/peroxidase EfeB